VGMTSLVVAARACPHKKETTRRIAPVEVILAIRCDDECQVGDDLGLGDMSARQSRRQDRPRPG
jgi:hypothetical protein